MKKQCGGGCLGAPVRALSRACNSACDLYVRGMSGAARHVPSGAADAVGRGGYARSPTASPMVLRVSSDRVEDLVRAAAKPKQGRRVAPATEGAADATGKTKSAAPTPRQGRRVAPAEVADAAGLTKSAAPVSAAPGSNKVGAAAAMETIAEDAACEFSACALPPPPSRRRAAAARGGLAARTGGFGAVRAGSQIFAH